MWTENIRKPALLLGLALGTLLSGCSQPPVIVEVPPSATFPMTRPTFTNTPRAPIQTVSNTETRTLTPTAMSTTSRTPFPTSTPNPNPTLPPSLEGTAISRPTSPLSLDAVNQITELARWGKGLIREIRYSADGRVLAVVTATDKYSYDGQTLREVPATADTWQIAFPSGEPKFEFKRVRGGYELWRENARVTLVDSLGPFVFSTDRSWLTAPQGLFAVGLWDTSTGELLKVFTPPPESSDDSPFCGGIESVTLSSDKELLAAGCYEHGGIYVWNVADGTLRSRFSSESYFVTSLAFSPDGSRLAGVVLGGDVCLWNVSAGTLIHCFSESRVNFYVGVAHLVFSPEGKVLVGGFSNGEVLVWQTDSLRLVGKLHPIAPSGASIAFSPNGQQIASTAFSKVIVWDLSHSTPHTTSKRPGAIKLASLALFPNLLSGPSGDVEFVSFSPDGTALLFTRDSSTLFYWPSDRAIPPEEIEPVGGIVAFTSAGEVTTVRDIVSLQDEGLVPLVRINSPNFSTYAFSPDRALIAESYFDGDAVDNLRVRRTSDGQTVWKLKVNYPSYITFSPDGSLLAFCAYDEVEVWNVRDWTLRYNMSVGDEITLASPQFSPDGQILATAGGNGAIYLWRVTDGGFLRTLEGHAAWIGDLAFSSDGTLLASTSGDGTVRVWGVP